MQQHLADAKWHAQKPNVIEALHKAASKIAAFPSYVWGVEKEAVRAALPDKEACYCWALQDPKVQVQDLKV